MAAHVTQETVNGVQIVRDYNVGKCYSANIQFQPTKDFEGEFELQQYAAEEIKRWCVTLIGIPESYIPVMDVYVDDSGEILPMINSNYNYGVLFASCEEFLASYSESLLVLYVVLDSQNKQIFIVGLLGPEQIQQIQQKPPQNKIDIQTAVTGTVEIYDEIHEIRAKGSDSPSKTKPLFSSNGPLRQNLLFEGHKSCKWWMNGNHWVSLYRRFTEESVTILPFDLTLQESIVNYYKDFIRRKEPQVKQKQIHSDEENEEEEDEEDEDEDLDTKGFKPALSRDEEEFGSVSLDSMQKALRWRLKLMLCIQKALKEPLTLELPTRKILVYEVIAKFLKATEVTIYEPSGRKLDELSFMLCRIVCCSENDFRTLFISTEKVFMSYKVECFFPSERDVLCLLRRNLLLFDEDDIISLSDCMDVEYFEQKYWLETPFKTRQKPRKLFKVPIQEFYQLCDSRDDFGLVSQPFSRDLVGLQEGKAFLFYYRLIDWLNCTVETSILKYVQRNVAARVKLCYDWIVSQNKDYKQSLRRVTKTETGESKYSSKAFDEISESDNYHVTNLSTKQICTYFASLPHGGRLANSGTVTNKEQCTTFETQVIKPFISSFRQIALEEGRILIPVIKSTFQDSLLHSSLINYPGMINWNSVKIKDSGNGSGTGGTKNGTDFDLEDEGNDTGDVNEEDNFEAINELDSKSPIYALFPLCMRRLVHIAKHERHLKHEERKVLLFFLAQLKENGKKDYLLSVDDIMRYWKYLCDCQNHTTRSRELSFLQFRKGKKVGGNTNEYGHKGLTLIKASRDKVNTTYSADGSKSYESGMSFGCHSLINTLHLCPFSSYPDEIKTLAENTNLEKSAARKIKLTDIEDIVRESKKPTYSYGTSIQGDRVPKSLCRKFVRLSFGFNEDGTRVVESKNQPGTITHSFNSNKPILPRNPEIVLQEAAELARGLERLGDGMRNDTVKWHPNMYFGNASYYNNF